MTYILIASTVLFTVTSQLLVKWHMSSAAVQGRTGSGIVQLVLNEVLSIPILLSIGCTFIAGVSWMGVLTKIPLTQAYPYSLTAFPIVILFSALLFGESLDWRYGVGAFLILCGLLIINYR